VKRLSWSIAIIIAVIVVLLASGYRWFSHREEQNSRKTQEEKINRPVALVKTVPIRKGTIIENITVYGVTIPAPGALQTVSVPFESRVRNVMVSNGQKVSAGDDLLRIEPSPDTYLQFEQARNTLETARQNHQHFQRLFDLKLATNDQLLNAKQTFVQARLNLESMKKRGINGLRRIRADDAGLISKVLVQEGAIAPAGSPIVEIVIQNRLEVRLGVESEDINQIQPNQEVLLFGVNVQKSNKVTGKIRKISSSVNPNTRLVDVFVALSSSRSEFLLDEFVLGEIAIASSQGLIVPRSAVLPEDSRYTLFTVKGERAVKHVVQIGLENGKEVEVIGTGLQPSDPVIILGNYELEDGMTVKAEVSQ
jgi:RND family efflux transporter MFP subunit